MKTLPPHIEKTIQDCRDQIAFFTDMITALSAFGAMQPAPIETETPLVLKKPRKSKSEKSATTETSLNGGVTPHGYYRKSILRAVSEFSGKQFSTADLKELVKGDAELEKRAPTILHQLAANGVISKIEHSDGRIFYQATAK